MNPQEAETIRTIMTRYVALGSVPALVIDLAAQGIVSKRRVNSAGRATGGAPYRRSALYALLANRLYLGETVHKGVAHPGEHEAVVDQALWDEVQRLLASNRVTRRHQGNADDPSLLAGMMHDSQGRKMSPHHAGKPDRRYRYHVSGPNGGRSAASHGSTVRIAAGGVEAAIVIGVSVFLNDPAAVLVALAIEEITTAQINAATRRAADIAAELETMEPSAIHALLEVLDLQVTVDGKAVAATISRERLASQLELTLQDGDHSRCNIAITNRLMRTGIEMRLAIAPSAAGAPVSRDGNLVALIVKAHQARDLLVGQGVPADAASAMSHRHLTRLARLAYLAPDIIVAILEGRQPRTMTSRSLLRISCIPLDWNDQRRMLGIA